MKKKTKILALLGCSALAVSLTTGGLTQWTASADEQPFAMKTGASVRMEEPQGIRFKAFIDQSTYDEVVTNDTANAKTFGMLIVPATYVNDYNAYKTENTTYTGGYFEYFRDVKGKMHNFVYADEANQIKTETNTVGEYTYEYAIIGSNVNILFNNVNRDFVGIAYVKTEGDSVTYDYAAFDVAESRSPAWVAAAAMQAGESGDALTNALTASAYNALGVTYVPASGNAEAYYAYNGGQYASLQEIPDLNPASAYALDKTELSLAVNGTTTLTPNAAMQKLPIKWTSDNQAVATVDQNGNVTAVGAGETTVNANVGVYTVSCTVKVAKPEVVFSAEIPDVDMSVSGASFTLPAGHNATSESTVKIGGETVAFTLEDNVVSVTNTALQATNLTGEQTVAIETADKVYTGKALLITKVIYDADDLDEMITLMKANKTDVKQIKWNSGGNKYATIAKYNGYFVLGDDIDYGSKSFTGISYVPQGLWSVAQYTNTHQPKYGFTGTFDGRGYTISNLNISNGGWGDWDTSLSTEQGYTNSDNYMIMGSMFGQIATGAVVKNVAFDGVNLAGHFVSVLAMQNMGTIENVQIVNARMAQTGNGGVLVGVQAGGTIKNVVVEVDSFLTATINGATKNSGGGINGGILIGGVSGNISAENTGLTGTIENVIGYFDKETALDMEVVRKNDGTYEMVGTAGTDYTSLSENGWAYSRRGSTHNDFNYYTGYMMYGTDVVLTALKTTNNVHCFTDRTLSGVDVTAFDSEYWTVVDGKLPLLKGYAAANGSNADVFVEDTATEVAYADVFAALNSADYEYVSVEGATYAEEKFTEFADTFKVTFAHKEFAITRTVTVKKLVKAALFTATPDVDMSVGASLALPEGHNVTESSVVKVAGNTVAFGVSGNTLTIASADLTALKLTGEQTVNVLTADKNYEGKALLISKIIYNATDLDEMTTILKANMTDKKSVTAGGMTYTIAKYPGYFVLGDNVNYNSSNFTGISFMPHEGYFNTNHADYEYPEYGFVGTFDGRGYKISNLNISNNGFGDWDYSLLDEGTDTTTGIYSQNKYRLRMGSMFGQIAKNSVVKNVAFDTVNVAGSAVSLLAMQNYGTIENVQVTNASMAQKGFAGVLVGVQAGGTIRNVVMEIDSMVSATINGSARTGDGSIFAGPLFAGVAGATDPASTTPTPLTGTIENVIVYYDENVALDSNATVTDNGWAFTRKGTTANDYAWYSGYRITSTDSILTGLKTTNNVHCFTDGTIGTVSTDGFDSNYWNVESGTPVFITKTNA